MTKLLESSIDRRHFLRRSVVGAAGIAAASIAACAPGVGSRWTYNPQSQLPAAAASLRPTATPSVAAMPGMTMDGSPSATPGASMAADMDALSEAVLKRFPEKTDLVGNQPMAPTMDGTT